MVEQENIAISKPVSAYRFRILFNKDDQSFFTLTREVVSVSVKSETHALSAFGITDELNVTVDLTLRMPEHDEKFYTELKEFLNNPFDMIVESLDGVNDEGISPIETISDCKVTGTQLYRSYESINDKDDDILNFHMKIESSDYELK